jgi:hypothetical protein
MLAYLMAQELRRLWRDLELTVQEGLRRLASLRVTQVRIGERASHHPVPKPPDDVRQLFDAARIPSPPRYRWRRPA